MRYFLNAIIFVSMLMLTGCIPGEDDTNDSIVISIPIIISNGNSVTATEGVAINPVTMTSIGGAVASYSISPAIGNGLSFDANTGTIQGTPTSSASSVNYTITATNSSGSDTVNVQIIVNAVALALPNITASSNSVTATEGVAINPVNITSVGGAVASYSISPAISNGLSFDANTGTIQGTPTSSASSVNYTITATNSSGSDTVNVQIIVNATGIVVVSGKITYERIHAKSNGIGLNHGNITPEAVKNVIVQAVDGSNTVVVETTTDAQGDYQFSLAENIVVKIRVLAKMLKTGSPSWDVKIVDNTNSDALYVFEGSSVSVGTRDSVRDLGAPSGSNGSSYVSSRTAAPFAVLDTIYSAMQKVLGADSTISFSSLQVNWSISNSTASGSTSSGQIGTSYYQDSNLYILGDANGDTDEYDDHVVAHEWGHYYEDKFSRSDSIGGNHSGGDRLDIRVAFGEGFGNAFSGMALDDPLYFDTAGSGQSTGFTFNVENETRNTPGWYSESSIQRILYDLYDSTDDGNDALSLGFAPLHQVFVGAEKTTPAFTSIFTFIKALKDENPANISQIDTIVSSESIATINDIYGTGRTNLSSQTPLYKDMSVGGGSVNICPSYTYGNGNKLGNHSYIKFDITTAANHTVSVTKSSGSGTTDPDFYVVNVQTQNSMVGDGTMANNETQSENFTEGSYIMDVSDYEEISGACFNVSIN